MTAIARLSIGIVAAVLLPALAAQIERPADAPQPLSPEESARRVTLPPGFRLELIAAEPVVVQPTGVCWDDRGRMFVCELHGYNLEGQYDIEELNRTGELDTEVRRISAPAEAVAKAERDQHGVVKQLLDTDGDGRMDRAEVWADDLPPCIGIVPAGDGVIVACAPRIVFLADRDEDGVAEIRETLFEGFALGPVERRINQPRWGADGWIYFGRGNRCRVTGPNLVGEAVIDLPSTDFRIRADGSAIEPVTGGTHSIGFALTGTGQRFVATTSSPGHQVVPLPWRYLARNPDLAPGKLQQAAASYKNCFQLSQPHPWRTKRAENAEFFKFYKDRYGVSESESSGWFTAGCSPLIYRDAALPGLRGHYLVCEPAANLVHRAAIRRDGPVLRLERLESESASEFLASTDIWFHPISLSHAPDGSIAIVDFYREIIEDYSAIPRYLQQQYQLHFGKDRGRIWRLVHEDMPDAPPAAMDRLSNEELTRELTGSNVWRRETALRLIREVTPVPDLNALDAEAAIAVLHAPRKTGELSENLILVALLHADPAVRVQALRLAEPRLEKSAEIAAKALKLARSDDGWVRLQTALSLGESRSAAAVVALAELAKTDTPWIEFAVQSSIGGRESEFLAAFGPDPPDWAAEPETVADRDARIAAAVEHLAQESVPLEKRLAAAAELGPAAGPEPTAALLAAFDSTTPKLRAAILDALLTPKDRHAEILETVPASALSAVQRKQLNLPDIEPPANFAAYRNALAEPREPERGAGLFKTHCALCHRVGEVGAAIGPDLTGETRRRAEETLILDLLAPSSTITPGYELYAVETKDGLTRAGLIASESPGALTLKDATGATHRIARAEIASLKVLDASLMPPAIALQPKDAADLIAWLRGAAAAPEDESNENHKRPD